jgi:hypothetical protein
VALPLGQRSVDDADGPFQPAEPSTPAALGDVEKESRKAFLPCREACRLVGRTRSRFGEAAARSLPFVPWMSAARFWAGRVPAGARARPL